MNQQITKILDENGIEFREHGDELITHCLFSDCDSDSKGKEAHLYINKTGQYFCHKCGAKGSIKGILEALGVEYPATYSRTAIQTPWIE